MPQAAVTSDPAWPSGSVPGEYSSVQLNGPRASADSPVLRALGRLAAQLRMAIGADAVPAQSEALGRNVKSIRLQASGYCWLRPQPYADIANFSQTSNEQTLEVT